MIANGIVNEKYVPVARAGTAPNPYGLHIGASAGMPTDQSAQDLAWSEVTDLRAYQLGRTVSQDNDPIYVYWSGGIDSTAILAAIVKNWSADLLGRVTVIMNNGSYVENPCFFNKIIKPRLNFKSGADKDWRHCWVITGYAADQTWVQADVIAIDIWRPGSVRHNPYTHRDTLVSWLEFKTDRDHANWVIDLVLQNAESAGIDIMDYEDFYWWLNFNFMFSGQLLKAYKLMKNNEYHPAYLQQYQKKAISWYASREYQLWSMANRSVGTKYKNTVRSYKMPAKLYIYELDQNVWYRDYKTKMASTKLPIKNAIKAIYNNGVVITTGTINKNYQLEW